MRFRSPRCARAVVASVLLALGAPALHAQARPVRALPQLEARLDAVLSPTSGAMAGVGVNVRAGWYARVGAALSAGAVRRGDGWDARQRLDATARFVFDPFGERTRGFYAGAGIGAEHRAGGDVRAVLLAVVGVEGATTARVLKSAELTLGDGVRVGVVLRQRRRQGR
jgi:hypothetical protein